MEFGFSDPRITNQPKRRSQNSSTLEGPSSHRLEGGNVPFPGVDWLNRQNFIRYPPVAHTQRYPSITQPSPEIPIFGGQPPPPTVQYPDTAVPPDTPHRLENKDSSHKPGELTRRKGFFALITPTDKFLEHGERILEDTNQLMPISAVVTVKPREDTNYTYYTLEIIGHKEKPDADLYLAFGFTRGYSHIDFSSAVCKVFYLKRYKSHSKKVALEKNYIYSVSRPFGRGVEELPRSQAAGILTSSFEEKVRAAYWRVSQQLSLKHVPGDHRSAVGIAIQDSIAGPSNSGSTNATAHAVIGEVQYKQQESAKPQGQFIEPPPTIRQPQHSHSSFLQEAAPALPYPSSLLLPPSAQGISHWTGWDGRGTAFGNYASTLAMQGGGSVPDFAMPAHPTFHTATSVPWYADCLLNSNFPSAGTDAPGHGLNPRVNHQATNQLVNYDFTYRHVSQTQAPFGDYSNAQTAGLGFNYPPADPAQADVSQVAGSSYSDIPAPDRRPIQIELEPAPISVPSRHSVPPPPSAPTATPEPVKAQPPRKRGRPRKHKAKPPPKPHFNSYPPSTSAEGVQTSHDQETRVVHAPEPTRPSITPVYNNVATAEALNYNPPPGMSFSHNTTESQAHYPPQGMYSLPSPSGFPYPSPYNVHHYQPSLVPQPSYTHVNQAASSTFDFRVPAAPLPQTQQSNPEDLLWADEMDQAWWGLATR